MAERRADTPLSHRLLGTGTAVALGGEGSRFARSGVRAGLFFGGLQGCGEGGSIDAGGGTSIAMSSREKEEEMEPSSSLLESPSLSYEPLDVGDALFRADKAAATFPPRRTPFIGYFRGCFPRGEKNGERPPPLFNLCYLKSLKEKRRSFLCWFGVEAC